MSLRERFTRIAEIRPGEGARTVLMFSTVLLIISAYTMTKAVRDAVFLAKFGLTELSYVMIGVAVVAGFLVSLFTRATAGFARNRLIFLTNTCVAVTLAALAPLLRAGSGTMAWVLYFWSSMFGLVLVAEFWLLANDLFNAREAKRLFPVIGAGAILGGTIGGALSGWLARPLGAANLLYIVAAQLLLAAVMAHFAWRRRPIEMRLESLAPSKPPALGQGLKIVRTNGYVRLLAIMMVLMTLCATFVQWQFKGIAKAHYGSRSDEMAAYFGILAAVLNAASFLLQIIGTPRLLRRFGIGVGLRVLPSGFFLGALCILASMVLPIAPILAASLAMLLSDGFRFSVDKASTELLYVPIPRATKDQAKPFIDTVVDRFAGALAGFAWLLLTWLIGVDQPSRIPLASVMTCALVIGWLFVIRRARRGYVDAYRRLLVPPRRDLVESKRQAACIAALGALQGAEPAARTRALRALSRLQRVEPQLRVPASAVEPFLADEAHALLTLVRASRAECVAGLLKRVVAEKATQSFERIMRLLCLAYSPRDVLAARRAFHEGTPPARAGALELLDNLVEGEAKRDVIAALDEWSLDSRVFRRWSRDEALDKLFALNDPWLGECVEASRELHEDIEIELPSREAEARC